MNRALYQSPPASGLLGDAAALIVQAEELERIAASEPSLSEYDGEGRERFWRASAALRAAAHFRDNDPSLFEYVARLIDSERVAS